MSQQNFKWHEQDHDGELCPYFDWLVWFVHNLASRTIKHLCISQLTVAI